MLTLATSSAGKVPSEKKLTNRIEKLHSHIHSHENYVHVKETENERTVLRRKLGSLIASVRDLKIFHKNRLKALKTDIKPNRKSRRYNTKAEQDVRVIKEEVCAQNLKLAIAKSEIAKKDLDYQRILDQINRISTAIKRKIAANDNDTKV